MTVPSFADQRQAWRRVPVDDIDYFDAADLLTYDDARLLDLIGRMEQTRYGGWRNHENRWRTTLGLDDTHGKRVLDYGCGVGLEALQYARAGNRVWLADVNEATVRLAARVLLLHGHPVQHYRVIGADQWAHALVGDGPFDVVHCAGVLHHIPDPYPTVALFHRLLRPGGELRLMLYAAEAWRMTTGTEPPNDVAAHPAFATFIRAMDGVGAWADWYDRERLEARFGDLFTVGEITPLGPEGRYLAAILTPKRKARR